MPVVDVKLHYTEQQIKDMEELVEIMARKKELEKEEKRLKDAVKKYMTQNSDFDCILPKGDVIRVRVSDRKTITKATKDQFIAELIGMNKQHLVRTAIEPDVDSIFAEVDSGQLDKDFVAKYIKVSEIKTLTVE